MFFTKEKKRDAKSRPEGKRPAPSRERQPEERRRRPEEDQAPERRKRPASEAEQPRRKRPAPEGEQPRRRRPAPEEEQPRRRRPAPEEEQPRRRRPAPEEEQPRRRAPAPQEQPVYEEVPQPAAPAPMTEQELADERLRRQVEAMLQPRAAQPEVSQTPEVPQAPEASQAEQTAQAAQQESEPAPAAEESQNAGREDAVFTMENAPRRNVSADPRPRPKKRTARHSAVDNSPGTRVTGSTSIKNAPQGTSYQRHSARARKNFFEKFIPSRLGKDPELMADEARMQMMQRDEVDKKIKLKHFDMPAMIYTQPKPFNRARLAVQLISVLAAVAAFVLALSIFFKVEVITISGAETYSPWTVREASGIMEGDNLLTFGRARACGQITAKLPYVDSVRIGIKLPNTVNIDIEELDVAYSVKSGDGDWWLITSTGKVVKQINESTAKDYTKVLGVAVDNPIIGEQAYAVEDPPEATTAEGETAPVTISGAQRLNAAMEILTALEENDIVGEAASVNVTDLKKIELWYGQRYQVNLGDSSGLEEKVGIMYDVILQLSDYQTGMLDVSFSKKQDQVIYTPFV